jgi:EAL domain-containing protein (putative c-di-GMP-specific phosphodiesterase class I)/AmiR/NasT family two-component response regulator
MPASSPLPRILSLLVVDDSQVQREHAVKLGRELGIASIYEAADGREALQLLSLLKLPPDLMLIDLEMPVMDGVELIEAMQQRGIAIPFFVASTFESTLLESIEAMARALGLPVLAPLQKPLTLESLRTGLLQMASTTAPKSDAPRRLPALAPERLAEGIAQGEIVVHYQPKVDIRTGLFRGVEALARWCHPELGLVPPDRFVALAEQHGLMLPLTLAVMAQSLAQAARWNARGLKLSVAINLSPSLLDRPQLVQDIEALVQQHGLSPDQVTLELTETSLAAKLGTALAMLARLRMKGFGLSLDDYGTGFSSMLQLARVPFTELKIDRSFVNGASQRKHLRVILQSALEMARRLELVTVAEGVETVEDWSLLQRFGCDIGQGWLFAHAMPAVEITDWMKQHSTRLTALRAQAAATAPLAADA